MGVFPPLKALLSNGSISSGILRASLLGDPAANFGLSSLSFLFSFSFCFKKIVKQLSY